MMQHVKCVSVLLLVAVNRGCCSCFIASCFNAVVFFAVVLYFTLTDAQVSQL